MRDKIATVTGGGSGIGRAAALAFAERGARVVVADVNTDGGQETISMIESAGGEALFVHTDVTKGAEVEALIDKTVATYQRIDYAFNNAGYYPGLRPIADYTEEMWDQTIAVNLKGVWLCMKYQVPHMSAGGSIVNTSSVAGLVAVPEHYGYTASKWGVCGITKSAAREFADQGIRVNAVCPGVIDTPMAANDFMLEEYRALHPLGRFGQPGDIASMVMWLCSEESSFITGQLLAVDGGWTA